MWTCEFSRGLCGFFRGLLAIFIVFWFYRLCHWCCSGAAVGFIRVYLQVIGLVGSTEAAVFRTQHFQWWSFRTFGSFHLIELWLFGTLVGNFMTGCWIVLWARYALYSVACVGSRGPNEFVRINQVLLMFPKVYAPTQWCSCSAEARVQKTDWQYVSFPCESFPPLPLSYCSPFKSAHTSIQPFSVHPVSRQVSAE